jgi:hypothetical protein
MHHHAGALHEATGLLHIVEYHPQPLLRYPDDTAVPQLVFGPGASDMKPVSLHPQVSGVPVPLLPPLKSQPGLPVFVLRIHRLNSCLLLPIT